MQTGNYEGYFMKKFWLIIAVISFAFTIIGVLISFGIIEASMNPIFAMALAIAFAVNGVNFYKKSKKS